MKSRVFSVQNVEVGTTMSDGDAVPALVVSAKGQSVSSGWSDAALTPLSCAAAPEDGMLDLDFVAEPPSPDALVLRVLTPIEAHRVLPVPDWVRGVRVHASVNTVETRLDGAVPAAAGGDRPVVWPWYSPAILPEFDIRLIFPEIVRVNYMPPVPAKLEGQATATMIVVNRSGRDELLTAATPCAIHHWELLDDGGELIDSEHDDLCIQHWQHRSFESGSTIRTDYVVKLNGRLLRDGVGYRLRFFFWGFQGEAAFTAHYVY
jgi:hypothetical protein